MEAHGNQYPPSWKCQVRSHHGGPQRHLRSAGRKRRDRQRHDASRISPRFVGNLCRIYAAQYLNTRSLSREGLEVKVTAEKAKHPARLGQFRIEVIVPGLDPQHEEGIRRAVKACLIHNTLLNAPAIETVITVPVLA